MVLRILFLTAVLFTAACGNVNGTRGNFTGNDVGGSGQPVMLEPTASTGGTNSISCAVTTSASLLEHQQVVSVTINATGGTAPYTLPGYGSFSAQKVVSGFYNNTSSVNRVVERSFQISDSLGNYGTCSFVVTVKPQSSSGSGPVTGVGNGCNIAATTGTPKLNTPFSITVTPTGVTSYKLKTLYLQNGWWEQIDQSYSAPASFSVTYRTKGARTISAVVEHSGQSYACSVSVNVTDPSVKLTASPTTGAPIGGIITVSAEAVDFGTDGTPVFTFAANDSAIQVTTNANSAVVAALDSLPHSFDLTVTATKTLSSGSTLIASNKVRLSFAPAVPVACSMRVPQTLLPMSGTVSIPVLVDGTNAPVTFSSAVASPDGVVAPNTSSPVVVTFNTSGMKTIVISGARSSQTGALCNGNGIVTQSISVVGPMTACSASTNANPSLAGATVRASVTLPAGAGYGPYELSVSNPSPYFQALEQIGQKEQLIRFRRAGTYTLTFTVRDTFTNQAVSCSSDHIVYEADTFAAAQDTPGNKVRVFKGPYPSEIFTAGGFVPFADVLPGFTGGVRVATADLNADGRADVVTAAGYNGSLRVRSWNGVSAAKMHDFIAFANQGTGTNRTYVGAGDINADGHADIILGTGCDSQIPMVEIYNGKTGTKMVGFRTFDGVGGSRVAAGDVDGDGYSDVVVNNCLSSKIRVFSGKMLSTLLTGTPAAISKEISAYPNSTIDFKVAVGDVDGDGFADVISATNGSNAPYIKVFDGRPGTSNTAKLAFVPFSTTGINYISAGDIDSDGIAEIFVGGDGTVGQQGEVKVFKGSTVKPFSGYANGKLLPFGNWLGRIYVGAGVGGL